MNLMQFIVRTALALVACRAAACAEQAANPPLGSVKHQASPDQPIGWRGDWAGRFPGATPPLIWSRRVKGITTELRYQAQKPAGTPGKEAKPLEYFTIKDWLVAGPFSVQEPVADIGKDFLGGEAAVEPAEGAKAGDAAWKFLRADVDTQSRHDHNEGTCGQSYVDFLFTFGKIVVESGTPKIEGDFNNKAAYAHTYIYSPEEARVNLQIPFTGAAGRFWLNGKPTDLDRNAKPYDVTLAKGWNRLLVKVTVAEGLGLNYDGRWLSKWLVAAYITPVAPQAASARGAAAPPISYETKNVSWMTKMTGRSMSQPIVVGERIFVGSGISDLLCIDKNSGKILWLQSSTPYDAMTPDERAALPIKDTLEPLLTKLNALNTEIVPALNAAVSPQGLPSNLEAELDKKLKDKREAERAVHTAFAKMDRKQYPSMADNEVSSSNATPCSDGAHVYWVCGGGMKGPGAYVLACFTLDGKRVWSTHAPLGASEHGNHVSPALVDGKLIYAADKMLYAYDAKTGKELWRNITKDWQNTYCGASPIVAKPGAESMIIGKRYIHRVSDGSEVCAHGIDLSISEATPIVENGILYNPFRFKGWKEIMSFIAVKLPASVGAAAPAAEATTGAANAASRKTGSTIKVETLWAPEGKDVSMALRGMMFAIASPLYVDGIVYAIEMSGGLTAVDPAAKKLLYRRWLDGYNRYNRFLYGVAASPTLGGKYIYITDDAGYTHVIQPGAEFKEIGKNILENLHFNGIGGNPCHQESFYTSPWFEGRRMYLRGEDYLYCIEEK